MADLIEVIGPDGSKVCYELGAEALVGRGTDATISIREPGASRKHARILRSGSGYVVEDLKSRNGTLVNGSRITRQALKHNDVIQIGKHKLRFVAAAAAPTAVAPALGQAQPRIEAVDGEDPVRKTLDAAKFELGRGLLEGESEDKFERIAHHLEVLNDLGKDIGAILKLDELLARVLDYLFGTFDKADMGFILLRDGERLVPRANKTRDGSTPEKLTVSRTVIREVVNSRKSVLSGDARDDFDGVQSILDQNIASVACVPLVCRGEVLGVIHLHSTGQRGAFDEHDLGLLTSISNQAAICVKNAQLAARIEQETRLRRDFQRYVSPSVAEQIVENKISVELGGQHRTGAVFFSDIVGFTAMSEKREPADVVALLNQYFHLMVEVIFQHEGTVNKFGGDEILAVWGAPLDVEDGGFKAIATGIDMQNAIFRLNVQLKAHGQDPIGMGIGINTGEFLAGNIGSEDRMEYTVIGDAVNLAARVESKAAMGQVLVTQSTYESAASRVCAVELPPTEVKGKSQPVHIYSIRGIADPASPLITRLSLPVAYAADAGQQAEALVTQARQLGDGGVELEVMSHERLPEVEELYLVPQLKGLPDLEPMTCRIASWGDDPAGPTTDFCHATLSLEDAGDRMLDLLEPGHCVKSGLDSLEGLRESSAQ